MEFYNYNHVPKTDVSDCVYYNYGMGILQVCLILWYMSHAFDWCRDPLAVALQKKLDLLEEDNIHLRDELKELDEELEDKWQTITSLTSIIDELRGILEQKQQRDSDSDSSEYRRKRRRE